MAKKISDLTPKDNLSNADKIPLSDSEGGSDRSILPQTLSGVIASRGYISFNDELPSSDGAVSGTVGGYFSKENKFQYVQWSGSEWEDIGPGFVVGDTSVTSEITPEEPLIISETTVGIYDSTKRTYKGSITVPSGRIAVGVVLDAAASTVTHTGVKIRIGTEEFIGNGNEFGNTNLANRDGLNYFEGGFILEIDTAGSYEFEVDATTPDTEIRGIIVRAPEKSSGIVEDCIQANNNPVETLYNGSYYRVHSEMYSGHIYLSIDGEPSIRLFDGRITRRNDRYHHTPAIISHPNGVAAFHCSRPTAYMDYKFMPSGNPSNITSLFQFGNSNSNFAYPNPVVLDDGRIWCLARGNNGAGDNDAVALMISNVTNPTASIDIIVTGGGMYPGSVRKEYDSQGNELIGCYWSERNTAGAFLRWNQLHAAIYDPNDGTYGKWYNLRKVEADINNAWGTNSSPRFNGGRLTDNATSNSVPGLRLIGGATSTQRYAQDAFFDFSAWNDGSDPKSRCFYSWIEGVGEDEDVNKFIPSVIRFALNNGPDRTISPGDFNGIAISAFNSYRGFVSFSYSNYNGVSTKIRIAITVRSEDRKNDTRYNEPENAYYDWGGDIGINVYEIETIGSDIQFKLIDKIKHSGDYTFSYLRFAENNPRRLTYQKGVNMLHETHNQCINLSHIIPEF